MEFSGNDLGNTAQCEESRLGANRNVECQREAERSIKPPSRDWVLRNAAAAESWRAAIHGKGSQGRSKTSGPVPKSDKECES